MKEEIIAGLDIGSSKVACIIAEAIDNKINIIGVGKVPSTGIKRGIVTNIDKTTEAIQQAIAEAERLAGVEVKDVVVGIKGEHIRSINSQGVVAIARGGREITQEDVDRAIDAATAFALPEDRKILHVIPKEFKVDNQGEIQEPVGMTGVRLEVDVHVITAAFSAIANLEKSIMRAGVGLNGIVLSPLATSYSVLKEDEMELGVALVDIGGGTIDIGMFLEGKLRYTSIIPIGGSHITGDIAYGLRTPPEMAEKLKIQYGSTLHSLVRPDETIDIPGIGGRPARSVAKTYLVDIIRPRVIEMLQILSNELKRSDLQDLMQVGAVLTGGTVLLPGFSELAEDILGMPVKIGFPSGVMGGLTDAIHSPVYSEAMGLILFALENDLVGYGASTQGERENFIQKFLNWFRDMF